MSPSLLALLAFGCLGSSARAGGYPDPQLTILRSPTLPAAVSAGQTVSGDFDWNVYSGDTQPGNPVWINVYAWRDGSGNWTGAEPVVFYNGIPGFYPGYTEYGEPISIPAPAPVGSYMLWAHAFPTVDEATALLEFKNAVITEETNVAKVLGIVEVAGTPEEHCLEWQDVSTAVRPTPTSHHAMAYDSGRQMVVSFGGQDGNNLPNDHNETWEWSCADGTWILRNDLGNSPLARHSHAMAYDSAHQVVVLFAGSLGGPDSNDTWEYDGTTWTEQSPAGDIPGVRIAHAMAYHATEGVTVLFGGHVSGTRLNDTWEWDSETETWTDVSPPEEARPPGREYPAMAYDSDCGVILIFGGQDGAGRFDDTWAWDGSIWTDVTPAAGNPSPRYASGMTYDSVRRKMIMFTGSPSGGGGLDDTWEWEWDCSTGSWTQIPTTIQPSARLHVGMVFDASCSKTVLFGGWTTLDDTWVYPGVENVDCNENGIPDHCDVIGDFDGNGGIDVSDIGPFVAVLLESQTGCTRLADINEDGLANGDDTMPFVALLLGL
jgi:hypothetical protein